MMNKIPSPRGSNTPNNDLRDYKNPHNAPFNWQIGKWQLISEAIVLIIIFPHTQDS